MWIRSALALWLLLALMPFLNAKPQEGQFVKGRDFEGVIFTPEMIRSTATGAISEESGLWTPSIALVLKAEAALPAAIAEQTKFPKPTRGPNYSKFYSAKNGTDLHLTDTPRPASSVPDSQIEDNFLYDALPYIKSEKRQYIGITYNGKKLLLSFFYKETEADFPKWKYSWVQVLDGGYLFWNVYYDPSTGKFSDWSCGGFG